MPCLNMWPNHKSVTSDVYAKPRQLQAGASQGDIAASSIFVPALPRLVPRCCEI